MLYQALDAARLSLKDIMLAEDFEIPFNNGIKYGETITNHVEILTLKGKKTRKYFHIIITRLDNGMYELVSYIS